VESSPGLPGAARQLLAAPNSRKLSIGFVYFALFLLVLLVKLFSFPIGKPLSLFLLLPSLGGTAGVNRAAATLFIAALL